MNTLFQDMEVFHPCTFSTSSSIFILPIIDRANEIQDFLQLLLHEHPYSGLLVLKLKNEEAIMERNNEELYSLIKVSAKSSNIVGDLQARRKYRVFQVSCLLKNRLISAYRAARD